MEEINNAAIENAVKQGLYHPTQFEKDIQTYTRIGAPKYDHYSAMLNRAFIISPSAHDTQALHDMMKRRFAAIHKREEQARDAMRGR